MKATIQLDLTPLENLKQTLVGKILRKATRKAAKIVKDAVKGNAEAVRRFGFLAKSIGVKIKVYGKTAVAIVGPKSDFKREKGVRKRGKNKGKPIVHIPSKYEHLIEKGTKRSKAKPVLMPALDSTEKQYLELLTQLIAEGIAEQLAKNKA